MTFILTLARFGAEYDERHEDIHEALSSAHSAVETNEACPVKLVSMDGLLGEFHDLSDVYEDSRYNRQLSTAEVIHLIHTIKAEHAQARLDHLRAKAKKDQEQQARLQDLVERAPLIEYRYCYEQKDLDERVLPPARLATIRMGHSFEGPYSDGDVETGIKHDTVQGAAMTCDMHLVRDPSAAGGVAPGHRHYMVITKSGDYVSLEHILQELT